MAKVSRPPKEHPVEVTLKGRTFKGYFTVEKGFIHVRALDGGGSKGTQVGGSEPSDLAGMLLMELASEHLRKP